jgi:ribosomal protein S18 acetylase RimI-like enzyme
MGLIGLSGRLDEDEVRALVREGTGSSASAARTLARYRSGAWTLLGYVEAGSLVGCIGVEQAGRSEIVVHSLAVKPGFRRKGIGRFMVRELATAFGGSTLVAETDADAVGFYRRCGFAVTSLGERYPGTERFRCTLPAR